MAEGPDRVDDEMRPPVFEAMAITLHAGSTRLGLAVGDDGRLHQIEFGPAGPTKSRSNVGQPDRSALAPSATDWSEGSEGASADAPPAGPSDLPAFTPTTLSFPAAIYPLAYPTFGEEPLREPALRITHVDGATSTRLVFASHEAEVHQDGELHRIHLTDRVAPIEITIAYRTWPTYDLIEQWVEVANTGTGPIRVHEASATAPAINGTDPHLTHWGGGWAGEWVETTEAMRPGVKTVASAGGVRPSLYRPPILLVAPNGPADEENGLVGACTVAWGGDIRFDAEIAPHGQQRILAGHQHRGADRIVEAGERFVTPAAYWTWSADGIGATSRSLHRYIRDHVARDGTDLRATVANTWEAVFFDLDTAGLIAQVDHASEIGAELFLLDDGWFGPTIPRNDDTTSLGDWEVDRTKLPDGLQPVIDHTLASGLRFGLWVEPEMISQRSALYAAHPDWVIGEPGRERREERQQLVLDVCQPVVQAFVVDVIDRVLADHTGISYLKWDANRDVTEPGTTALSPERQSHMALDRVQATDAIMAEVARRHPEVELMLCASGGGRSDVATLAHFHELWTSDNTDPVDRVRIQWGASHLLPASVMAAHVTRWGERPIEFACAVAMSGRFGFDLDLRGLSDHERAVLAQATARYRTIRSLVQHGDLHRLVSPIGTDRGALAFVDPDGHESVVFAYRLPVVPGASSGADGPTAPPTALPPPIELPWLDRNRPATVRALTPGQPSGAAAQLEGMHLDWPAGPAPVASVVTISQS